MSPVGPLKIAATDSALVMCDWEESPRHQRSFDRLIAKQHFNISNTSNAITTAAIEALRSYFANGTLPGMPYPPVIYGTDLQRTVMHTLSLIPPGQTVTYTQLAAMAGYPRAVRAVASAIAQNILSIFLPCHRVVPVSHIGNARPAAIGNYRGGSTVKAKLLALEGIHL